MFTSILNKLIFRVFNDMRKAIGSIVILLIILVGIFGCERFNIPPFISNWFKSDDSSFVKEISKDVGGKVINHVKNETDSVVNKTIK